MSSSFQNSVILITSRDPYLQQKRAFGTGFIIARNNEATYVLTCTHVVQDVGGEKNLLANGVSATVVALSEEFDLAVLQVEGLWNLPVLPLSASGKEKKPFEIAGFYTFDQKGTPMLRPIKGYLGKQTEISSIDGSERIKAWDLHIDDEDNLQAGYSGSPVVDIASGVVLAMVISKDSKRGYAISIETVKKTWLKMPIHLVKSNLYTTVECRQSTKIIEVFISYSNNKTKNNDKKFLDELVDYISSFEELQIWHEGKIIGGQNPKIEIEKHFTSSHIILLLISQNFLRDYESKEEIKLAMKMQKSLEASVIPVLLSQVQNWERFKFGNLNIGELQSLPKNGKFVTGRGWKNKNEAFSTISK